MDANLSVTFGGNDCLSFVQGEDRSVLVCFFDQAVGMPVDLTGAAVSLSMPAALVGVVRRSSAPIVLSPASIAVGTPGTVAAPDHGLVTGDAVQFVGSGLPAPLVAGTAYAAVVTSPDALTLTQAGAPVALASAGSGAFSMATPGVVINPVPQTGCATFTLSAACTAGVAAGQAQGMQVGLVSPTGQRRICVLATALTVTAQPEP